jgi:hypothetical protein
MGGESAMLEAVIKDFKGVPTIVVEGKPLAPMTFCSRHYTNPVYVRRLYENGIRVFFIFTKIEWLDPGAFEQLEKTARFVLDNAPDAYLIMRVNVDAPKEWCEQHPEEVIRFQTGALHGHYSFASEAWQKRAGQEFEKFIDRVEKTFIAKRNLGYFLNAGGTEEWYVPKTYDYWNLCVGFCEPFRKYYSRWLKTKYGSDASLQAAWKKKGATIADPLIPPFEDRILARTDREHNVERVEHTLDLGAILDPDVHQYLADFYEAYNDASADALIHLATRVKEKTRRKQIVGAFYGAFGCVMYHEWGTSSYTKVMESGVVDFLSAPSNYENRFPPGSSSFTNPIDSLRVHNMIWFNEEDDRTHLAGGVFARCLDTETSTAIMKRNCGKVLCEDAQSWWFENSRQNEWWDSPELMRVLGRIQELASWQYGRDRTKLSEIAFVYSQESIWVTDQETLKDMFQFNKMLEIGRIGAPSDHIMVDDLAHKEFQHYKLYVFMNTVSLSTKQRKLIDEVVKTRGKGVIWVHASGMINPEAEKRLSVEHASELAGIRLKVYPLSLDGTYFVVKDAHPIVIAFPPNVRFGQFDQSVDCLEAYGNPQGTPFRASRVNPVIVPEDAAATALARYSYFTTARGKTDTAIALKPMDGWSSIYWGPKVLDAEVIRSAANYFGVHIYNWDNDLLYANRDFLAIHAYTAGTKQIHLPRQSDVVDAFEDEVIGQGIRDFRIEMKCGESRVFSLNGTVDRQT